MGIKFLMFVIMAFVIMLVLLYLRSIGKIKYSTNMRVEKYNLELKPEINTKIFNDISRKLVFAGFEDGGDYKIDSVDMGATDFSRNFIYKDLSTRSTITYTDIRKDGVHISKYSFNILTKFKDGYKVITRDNNDSYLFKENSIYINEIKSLDDINSAIRKHIEKVKELSKDRELKLIDEDKSYEIQLNQQMEEDYRNQVDQGILKQVGEDCYRFTTRGMIRGSLILTRFSLKSIPNSLRAQENSFLSRQERLVDVGENSSKRKNLKRIFISISIYGGVFFLIVMYVLIRR